MNLPRPDPFLEVVVHNIELSPGVSGLSVGYERGQWRCSQFADHLMEWLPEFALSHEELKGLNSASAIALLRRAAKAIYSTKKFHNRGEFGEILLHAVIRQVFGSVPAISKIYYKDSANDTVKGFDAVHVVPVEDELELWIGEVKFYKEINSAIRDVVDELTVHTETDYLRDEFALIGNKVDKRWPHAEKLLKLIHRNTPLDDIFSRTCIPVLLTYESTVVANNKSVSDEYIKQLQVEFNRHYDKFMTSGLPSDIRIHLILVPLEDKKELVKCLNDKLSAWRNI